MGALDLMSQEPQSASRWEDALAKAETMAMAYVSNSSGSGLGIRFGITQRGRKKNFPNLPRRRERNFFNLLTARKFCEYAEQDSVKPALGRDFEELRDWFWMRYGPRILDSLGTCFPGKVAIRPAPLVDSVQTVFYNRCRNADARNVLPAFHGTNAAN